MRKPDGSLGKYLAWQKPKLPRDDRFEQALLDYWHTGKVSETLHEALQPETLTCLNEARRDGGRASANLLEHAIFQAAPEPILITSQTQSVSNPRLQTLLQRDALRQGRFAVAERLSALQPIAKLADTSMRINRRSFILPLDETAYSATMLVSEDEQSTIIYFRELNLKLPSLPPASQAMLLLRFAGFKAKEVAFVLDRPAATVNYQAKLYSQELKQLYEQVYVQNQSSHSR